MAKSSNLESFLEANKSYMDKFGDNGSLPAPPSRKTFILTCIDARLVPYDALGLSIGECHIFRNAGGRVSDDAIRSFTMTQQLMGTEEIFVMHHTQCGVEGRTNQDVVDLIQKNLGEDASHLDFLTCTSARASVSEDVDKLKDCKLINPGTKISGLLYHVETGQVEHIC
ncbi:hypothetical protein M9435_002821 [Picochlorum sp. BPE23]|nr:hypothetical protein M9435_002821 [Picochlorum sp. BPE23]